jgi:hypothetical protein
VNFGLSLRGIQGIIKSSKNSERRTMVDVG